MKSTKLLSALLAAALTAAFVTNIQAQEKPKDAPKKEQGEKKKSDAYPYRGKVASANKSAMTVTLEGKEKARVIKVTSETRIEKAGKPATFDDAKAGEYVTGQVKKAADGSEVATLLRIGPAPEGKAKKDGEKKKEKK